MIYVDCPKTNIKCLVLCYVRDNKIEDLNKFEIGFDALKTKYKEIK